MSVLILQGSFFPFFTLCRYFELFFQLINHLWLHIPAYSNLYQRNFPLYSCRFNLMKFHEINDARLYEIDVKIVKKIEQLIVQ